MHKNNNSSRLPSAKTLVALFALALPVTAPSSANALDNAHDELALQVYNDAKTQGIEHTCALKEGQKIDRPSYYGQPARMDSLKMRVEQAGYFSGITAVRHPLAGETPCEGLRETREEKPNEAMAKADLSSGL